MKGDRRSLFSCLTLPDASPLAELRLRVLEAHVLAARHEHHVLGDVHRVVADALIALAMNSISRQLEIVRGSSIM